MSKVAKMLPAQQKAEKSSKGNGCQRWWEGVLGGNGSAATNE